MRAATLKFLIDILLTSDSFWNESISLSHSPLITMGSWSLCMQDCGREGLLLSWAQLIAARHRQHWKEYWSAALPGTALGLRNNQASGSSTVQSKGWKYAILSLSHKTTRMISHIPDISGFLQSRVALGLSHNSSPFCSGLHKHMQGHHQKFTFRLRLRNNAERPEILNK